MAARLSTAAGSPQQITEPSPRRSFWSWNPCLGIALRCSWWINVSTCFLQWIHMDSWWFMQSLELWNRCQKMVTHGDAITCSTVGKIHIVVEAVGRTSLISLYILYYSLYIYISYTILFIPLLALQQREGCGTSRWPEPCRLHRGMDNVVISFEVLRSQELTVLEKEKRSESESDESNLGVSSRSNMWIIWNI